MRGDTCCGRHEHNPDNRQAKHREEGVTNDLQTFARSQRSAGGEPERKGKGKGKGRARARETLPGPARKRLSVRQCEALDENHSAPLPALQEKGRVARPMQLLLARSRAGWNRWLPALQVLRHEHSTDAHL